MAITTQPDVYALFLPTSTLNTWLYNQPILSSFLVKSIGFLQLQWIFDILGARYMEHCAFLSTR
jgi:hypothetical protein